MEGRSEEYLRYKKVEIYCNEEKNNAIVLEWGSWGVECCWERLFRVLVDNLMIGTACIWVFNRKGAPVVQIPIEILPVAMREVIEEKLGEKGRAKWVVWKAIEQYRRDVLSVGVEYREEVNQD